MISGALAVPSLIIGSLLSGFLIKRFKWGMKQCLLFLSILLFLNLSAYAGYLFSCKEPNFVFNNECTTKKFQKSIFPDNDLDKCFSDRIQEAVCNCDQTIFKPVCLKGSSDIVFESACLAGCSSDDKKNRKYTNCLYADCISNKLVAINSINPNSSFSIENGLCELPGYCRYKLYLTYVAIVLVLLFTGLIYIPYMKITFGCVASDPEMSAIALGIKQLAMVGVGTIPGW